ncbi:MAG: cobalamin-dependent protein [Phycisphaeraceae bacterium]|nr:cobalamin-dependent protein [Phycisphaeraceae bacterium]
MNREVLQERFFETLITGSRPAAREVISSAVSDGLTPTDLISDLFWPTYQTVDRLHRADQLPTLSHHLASRLLRVLVDQNAARLVQQPRRGRSVFCACGPSDADELGAQMAVDLIESNGFDIMFSGGGIANDELLGRINEDRPDVLLMFSSAAQDLPNIRTLIDTLHEIGACPNMQIAVGGGVFNRADGLAEEIGADLWASDPISMVEVLASAPARRASVSQRTVGRNRRVRNVA